MLFVTGLDCGLEGFEVPRQKNGAGAVYRLDICPGASVSLRRMARHHHIFICNLFCVPAGSASFAPAKSVTRITARGDCHGLPDSDPGVEYYVFPGWRAGLAAGAKADGADAGVGTENRLRDDHPAARRQAWLEQIHR